MNGTKLARFRVAFYKNPSCMNESKFTNSLSTTASSSTLNTKDKSKNTAPSVDGSGSPGDNRTDNGTDNAAGGAGIMGKLTLSAF